MKTIEVGYVEYHLHDTVAWVALLMQGKVCVAPPTTSWYLAEISKIQHIFL